jgi:site-specific recombinase XerC
LHNRADSLGLPLQVNTIGQRQFGRLIGAAGVRRIKFHGLRHTVATLMLSAGVPAHVVQHRLGHAKIEMTLGIYAHALPSMQQEAAAKMRRSARRSSDTSKSVADNLIMCRRNTWLVCTFTLQTLSSQEINAPHSGSMPKTWAGQS